MAAINMPTFREKKEDDPLDLIMKGLNIAGSVYGLYTNTKNIENQAAANKRAEEAAAQNREEFSQKQLAYKEQQQGIIRPQEKVKLLQSGWTASDKPEAQKFTIRSTSDTGENTDEVVGLAPPGETKFAYAKQLQDIQNARTDKILASHKENLDKRLAADAKAREARARATERQNQRTMTKEEFTKTSALRKEFDSYATTKETIAKRTQYDTINAVPDTAEKRSPQDEIGLVFSVMKMWDTNSTVRESEYKLAEEARSVTDSAQNYFTKVTTGERLTDKQVMEMKAAARRGWEVQQYVQNKVNQRYGDLAVKNGLDATQIITDLGSATDEQKGLTIPGKQNQPNKDTGGLKIPSANKSGATKPTITADDQAALDWLKANPKDPDANSVREKLKAKGIGW